jgi:formate hydrogenlyase subunit 4
VDDLVYMFAIWCVSTVLYVSVNNFEPNRRLAVVLQFLILAVGSAAVVSRVMR